ncbi:MAG: hypothetical protein WA364_03995 [Candidatus Nitrosopolaris sp.]
MVGEEGETATRADTEMKQDGYLIDCACGCETKIWNIDSYGRRRGYANGHCNHGSSNGNWKCGRTKYRGYWFVLLPDHPHANNNGYVRDTIIKIYGVTLCDTMPIGSSYTATKDLVPHTCMCRCRMMIRNNLQSHTGNPLLYMYV